MATYRVGGITLPNVPIEVGAGACKSPSTTFDWLKVAPVVSGSYTPERREGNTGDRLFHPDTLEEFLSTGRGYNWFGMPNIGFAAAARAFDRYAGEQPLIISVAGFSIDDYIDGVETFSTVTGVAAIELNFGCHHTGHGTVMSFDPRSLAALFRRLETFYGVPIRVKFSPYDDLTLLKHVASIVNRSRVIKAVVTCNTVPNQHAGKGNISSPDGRAGMSGPAIKPIALRQVMQFRKHLKPEIDVIGVGGITTGNDVMEFLRAGAKAVQLTSLPFWLGKPGGLWPTLLDPETGNELEAFLNDQEGASNDA